MLDGVVLAGGTVLVEDVIGCASAVEGDDDDNNEAVEGEELVVVVEEEDGALWVTLIYCDENRGLERPLYTPYIASQKILLRLRF